MQAKIIDRKWVVEWFDERQCYHMPSLTMAPDGTLLAVIDERVADGSDLGTNRNINLVLRRSSDNGDSWSDLESLVDYPDGRSASDPSLMTVK